VADRSRPDPAVAKILDSAGTNPGSTVAEARDRAALDRAASAEDRAYAAADRRKAATDLTELRVSNRELAAAAIATTQFVANVSHELRTPMTAVVGMTELLRATALDSQQAEYAEAISVSAEHLLTVVNDILDYTRLGVGQLRVESQPLDLRRVCEDVVALVAGRAREKGLELVLRFESGVPSYVVGDPGRLRQVLVNLLSNAVNFTAHGTVLLRVTAAGIDRGDRALVAFAVSDTGIGIASERIHELFRPFAQLATPSPYGHRGTGLGLAISRELAELMDGSIRLRSEPGVGSTFTVELPLPVARTDEYGRLPLAAVDDSRPIELPPSALAEVGARRILVVDDNPLNRRVAERMLAHRGFVADTAADGLEALAAARRRRYDLVFMDLHMPVMSGAEATRAIREQFPADTQPYIVGLSAGAFDEDRDACLAAGMDSYVIKPFRLDVITAAIAASYRP
jgi:signal transduction histidine kinase/ActR/RegA family two-component response regulator